MSRLKDLCNQRFGKLLVLSRADQNDRGGRAQWLCACDCGNQTVVPGHALQQGKTKSCGCLRAEASRRTLTTHGATNTKTYRVWATMKARCNNPRSEAYPAYGGRGIRVCERWLRFENFLADMGFAPPGMWIDRIDNDGNYEPGNCRWETPKQQCRHRRSSRLMTAAGRTMTQAEWIEELGISQGSLNSRLREGWSDEEALLTPFQPPRGGRKVADVPVERLTPKEAVHA